MTWPRAAERALRGFWALGVVALGSSVALSCGDPEPVDAGVDSGTDAGSADAGPLIVVLPDDREACRDTNPLKNPYFGDLHVHTSLSFDANRYGVRTRPRDAYRFARGEPIDLPPYDGEGNASRTAQLDRPLDFAAVTDHAEFFGVVDICTDPGSVGYESSTCRSYRAGDSALPNYGELTFILVSPSQTLRVCATNPGACEARHEAIWQEVQDAAEAFQDRTSSCAFSTLVGYEWTGSDAGNNLHRNVLFRGRTVPRVPTSYLDASSAERLYDRLEATCLDTGTPCDVLIIPHNGNLGGGTMFVPAADDGTPYDAEGAARRARLEPLLEIYQHKGASECVSGVNDPLASEDELCDFEMFHPNLCTGAASDPEDCIDACEGVGIGFLGSCIGVSDLARGILRNGLAEYDRIGVNPFQFGFIGSTDTHVATAGLVREEGWPGHAGENEDDPTDQLRIPDGALVRGRTASPGGLAVLWAEENSREALFDAMRRRETYATSGPRIIARLFAGWALPTDLCARVDQIEVGYRDGVPMGGTLGPAPPGGIPTFFSSALRDALGAPLQRIQIVKGWLEGGETHEAVYELAGDPNNGASVDEATCATSGDGFDDLCGMWTDPDFDASEPAFYYARVVENPTCGWSRYACNAAAVDCASADATHPLYACCDPAIDHTVQERAWTSPVWYVPQ